MPKPTLSAKEIFEGLLYSDASMLTIGALDWEAIDLALDEDEVAEIVGSIVCIYYPNGVTDTTLYKFSIRSILVDVDVEPADFHPEDNNIIDAHVINGIFLPDDAVSGGGGFQDPNNTYHPIGKGGSETRGWITARKQIYHGADIEFTGSSVPSGTLVFRKIWWYKHRVSNDALVYLLRR